MTTLWQLLTPTVGTVLDLTSSGGRHTGVVRRVRIEPGGGGEVGFVDGYVMRLVPIDTTAPWPPRREP